MASSARCMSWPAINTWRMTTASQPSASGSSRARNATCQRSCRYPAYIELLPWAGAQVESGINWLKLVLALVVFIPVFAAFGFAAAHDGGCQLWLGALLGGVRWRFFALAVFG